MFWLDQKILSFTLLLINIWHSKSCSWIIVKRCKYCWNLWITRWSCENSSLQLAKLFFFMQKIVNISKYHHFRFSRDHAGVVFCKVNSKSVEVQFKLFDKKITGLPETIQPKGLSFDRKSYLYREIRPFCRVGTEDLVAPRPLPTAI